MDTRMQVSHYINKPIGKDRQWINIHEEIISQSGHNTRTTYIKIALRHDKTSGK